MMLRPRSSAIRFASESLVAEWLGILQALPQNNTELLDSDRFFDEPLRGLRMRRDRLNVGDEIRLGASEDARTITTVVDDLRAFGESLLTAVVDPGALIQDATLTTSTVRTAPLLFDRNRSLFQQLPILSERCEELSYHLSLSPSSPGSPPLPCWHRQP